MRFCKAVKIPLLVLAASLLAGRGFCEESPEAILFEYEVLREEILKPISELENFYRDRVAKLREEAVRAGKLDLVVACDTELKSIGLESPSGIEPKWSELLKLQRIYLESLSSRNEEVEPTLEKLKSASVSRLEAAIMALTREEKIDEALAAKEMKQRLQNSSADTDLSRKSSGAGFSFNLEEGSYGGASIGDTEEEMRKAFKENGLDLFKTTPMSNGSKNISASGINFRINSKGDYYQVYILGDKVEFSAGLKLMNSTIEDFSKLLSERARKIKSGSEKTDHYEIKTRNLEILLITAEKESNIVKSMMVSER